MSVLFSALLLRLSTVPDIKNNKPTETQYLRLITHWMDLIADYTQQKSRLNNL